jgi:hypothetical protein
MAFTPGSVAGCLALVERIVALLLRVRDRMRRSGRVRRVRDAIRKGVDR